MTEIGHIHLFCIDPILLHCERCGAIELVKPPCTVEAFCTQAGAFIEQHQSCQPKELPQ